MRVVLMVMSVRSTASMVIDLWSITLTCSVLECSPIETAALPSLLPVHPLSPGGTYMVHKKPMFLSTPRLRGLMVLVMLTDAA